MDDLISRLAAIDAVVAWTVEDRPDIEMPTDLINRIKNIPSAQPEPHWIPCSERLPEKDQICIVTDDTQRCAYEYGFHNDTYDEVNGWTYLGHKIIAWMPLPEPWRGESNEL